MAHSPTLREQPTKNAAIVLHTSISVELSGRAQICASFDMESARHYTSSRVLTIKQVDQTRRALVARVVDYSGLSMQSRDSDNNRQS